MDGFNIKNTDKFNRRAGFTLSETLLATALVGIIAALVLPATVSHYNERIHETAYNREVSAVEDALNNLAIAENKTNFRDTMMYQHEEPTDYSNSSGQFVSKYLKIDRMCSDTPEDCFASKYYIYSEGKKLEYTPNFKGTCAILKNGTSICITPSVKGLPMASVIDLNGKKGPNVFNRDLREVNFFAPPFGHIASGGMKPVWIVKEPHISELEENNPEGGGLTAPPTGRCGIRVRCNHDGYGGMVYYQGREVGYRQGDGYSFRCVDCDSTAEFYKSEFWPISGFTEASAISYVPSNKKLDTTGQNDLKVQVSATYSPYGIGSPCDHDDGHTIPSSISPINYDGYNGCTYTRQIKSFTFKCANGMFSVLPDICDNQEHDI